MDGLSFILWVALDLLGRTSVWYPFPGPESVSKTRTPGDGRPAANDVGPFAQKVTRHDSCRRHAPDPTRTDGADEYGVGTRPRSQVSLFPFVSRGVRTATYESEVSGD